MSEVMLTPAHWVYLAGVVVIIVTMAWRSNVVAPAMAATFATALAMTGDPAKAIEALFYGPLTAASELFNIFLVIALMTAFMNALRALRSDMRMVQPLRHIMVNADMAFLVLGLVSYLMALFFWPTPSVPIIAGILLPAAIYAGVPPMGAAVCIAIAGLGTALSSDYVIKVAPAISAKAAGVPVTDVADKALVLSLITGVTAFVIAYVRLRRFCVAPSSANLTRWEDTVVGDSAPAAPAGGGSLIAPFIRYLRTLTDTAAIAAPAGTPGSVAITEEPHFGGGAASAAPSAAAARRTTDVPARVSLAATGLTPLQDLWSRGFAILTPVSFLAIVAYMILPKLIPGYKGASGADAAALVGGAAAVMLILATAAFDVRNLCRDVAAHVTEGFIFSFRAMSSVLLIAGFFFIGVANTVGPIVGLPHGAPAPALLADLVRAGENYAPHTPFFAAFSILLSGMVTGIDGSGFAGLPLIGALAGALGHSTGLDISTLAAVGQMGSVWTGKTLCSWSALAAVASFARVPVFEAVRNLLVPVLVGLAASTIFAVTYW